ncbi:thioredoxin family protein [Panacibacter microcysteis]|nr:thioredoxin family protein [Panacibacter microcysteis]
MITAAIRKHVSEKYTDRGMYYDEYRRLIDAFLMVGKSTAKKESESLVEYSKLNVVRMNRLDKTTAIIPELEERIRAITAPQTWLILTEGWCGDAAQIIPVLQKMTALNNHIQLKCLLRDENLELMDQYLTNGISRSIPKLVVLDENNNELFSWGPRPAALQELYYHMKANAMNNDVIKEEIHKWYAKDKTVSIQKDILALLENI